MADASGTIIIGQLNDTEFKKSIDALVKHVQEQTNLMATSFDTAITKINESLKNVGTISAQASTQSTARAESAKKETQAVKESTLTYDDLAKAVKRVVDANSGIKQSFNQQELQSYISLLRNVQNQYEQMNLKGTANTITNDAMRGWMQSLEQVIAKYQEILKNIDYVNGRQGTIDTKQWIQGFSSVDERLKQLNNWYKELEKEDQKRIANAEKAEKKRIADLEAANKKALALLESERKAREKMAESARKAELRYQDTVLKTQFQRTLKMPTESVDQMQQKLERLRVLLDSLQNIGLLSPAQIVQAEQAIAKLNNGIQNSTNLQQRSSQTTQQQTRDYSNLLGVSKELEQTQRVAWLSAVKSGMQAQQVLQRYREELQKIASTKNGNLTDEDVKKVIGNYQNLLVLLRQVRTAYYSLNESQRRSSRGVALFEDMKQLERLVPQMQRLDISLLSTKEKIAELQGVIARLASEWGRMTEAERQSAAGQELRRKIDGYNEALNRLRKTEEGQVQVSQKILQANKEIEQSNVKLISSNNKLQQTFDYIQRRVAFLLTTYGSMNLLRQIINVRSEFESMERSIGVLVDSAQHGSEIFRELNQMALNSPFTTMELGQAARQLLAYGVAENELVDTTRRLADISAAVGTPIDRIAYALGQIQTYGYLTSIQSKTLMRAGIPIVKELAQVYSELEGRIVSTSEVYDRMKHRMVSYDDVMKVINKDTDEGGRFFDYQAKMASTLKVQLANLDLAWQNMLNDIGKSNQSLITAPIKGLRTLMTHWKDISQLITAAAIAYGIYRTAMLVSMKVQRGKMILDTREMLGSKTATYQTNERRLALGKLSLEQRKYVLEQRRLLTAQYEAKIANDKLTASEVRKMLQIDKSNIALAQAAYNLGLITKAEYKVIMTTNATAGAFSRLGKVMSSNWVFLLLTFVTELAIKWFNMGEVAKEVTNTIVNSTKESAKSLKEFLDQSKDIRNSLYEDSPSRDAWNDGTIKSPDVLAKRDLPHEEATKVWESIRDEIQKSAAAADVYIAQLMNIENVSERVRKGFDMIETIKNTHEQLQLINKDSIEINESWSEWYTLWIGQDGLIKNTKEFRETLEEVLKTGEKFDENAIVNDDLIYTAVENAKFALDDFKGDLKDTLESLRAENVRLRIVDPAAERESFEQLISGIAADTQASSEDIMIMRIYGEKMYANIAKQKLNERLDYAMRIHDQEMIDRTQKEIESWDKSFGLGRASMQVFFEDYKRAHSDAFASMNATEIESINENSAEWKRMIDYLNNEFKNSQVAAHQAAYLDLKDKVDDVNTWKIFIPVYFNIQNEDSLNTIINKIAGTRLNLGDISDTADAEEELNKQFDEASKKLNTIGAQLKQQGVDIAHINLAHGNGNAILENQIESYRKQKEIVEEIDKARKAINAGASKQETKDQKEAAKAAKKAQTDADRAAKKAKREAEKAANKAKREAEAAERERLRKQREAEQELANALRDEVSIVDKLRTTYDKLRKSGVSPERIANNLYINFEETVKDLNKSLKKYGLDDFSVFDVIDPTTHRFKEDTSVFDLFDNQLKQLKASGKVTRNALKALEEELFKLWENIETKAMTGIADEFKKRIDDLGTGYDLAIEVEESPELADLLSNMMQIDVSDLLKDAPKTLREYTNEVNKVTDGALRAYYENMDKSLNEEGIKIKMGEVFGNDGVNILDKATFEKIREELGVDSELYKGIEKLRNDLISKNKKYFADVEKTYNEYLKNHGDFADKIREIEDKKYDDLRKLDDAYSTQELKNSYDYSRKRKAIIQSEKEAIQKLRFEEFKDSETYLLLFDDLEHVSSTTMTMIINKLHDMRKELSDLDPSELKKLAEYEEKLRSQMLKRNPFKDLKKDWKEYIRLQKNRQKIEKAALDADEAVENQQKIVAALGVQAEEAKSNLGVQSAIYKMKENQIEIEMKRLKLLKKNKDLADEELRKLAKSEVEMRQRAAGLAEYLGYAKQGTEALLAMAEASNNIDFQKSAEALDDVVGNLQAAAQGYAQGGWVGAVAAGVSDLVPKLIKWANSETKIDRAIQRSEREVKRLENSLKNLEDTASNAYGAYTIATQNAIIANKELQLAELQRQLRLEQSRKRKKQDKDKIADLKGQIIDLRNEIKNASADVVNDLLNISSAGDWAENLVQSIIDAFKQGEDAMDKFSDSWDDMIDHMMMKWLVSNFIQKWWDNILLNLKDIEERYTKELAEEKAKTKAEYDNLTLMSGYNEDARLGFMNVFYRWENGVLKETEAGKDFLKYLQEHGRASEVAETDMAGFTTSHGYSRYIMDMAREWYKGYMSNVIGGLDEQMYQASMDAIPEMVDYLNRVRPQGQEIIEQLYGELGKYFTFGEDNEKQLSQLQQGIQGITEDTAGALEAYMNGVSQQVYYQSDILTQIRDSLLGFDPNLVMGVQSQILLELQNSYQIQVAIQTLLQGWSAADGNSVKVTLV